MKVSVIIISYNCKSFLDYCIQSVTEALKNTNAEIIVFDNSSTDGTVEFLRLKDYNIKLIESDNNLGFSKANNEAVKSAKGEYLFFLNPDTIIPEDFFDNFFKKDFKNFGIYGCRMIDGRGNFLRESKRNFPNSKIIFKKIIGLKSNYYSKLNEFDFGEVDVLCGANMIVKNLTYKKIDGFNNDYFMFGEDIELSYRFKNIGYCNFYDGNMTIVHFKGESTKTNINYMKNFYGAMEIYYQNIFSSNWFLLFMIKIISKFLIFINVLMPKKHNMNFQTAKNILFSNKLNTALDKRFEGIILKSKIDKSFENCNLILDPNYLTFKQIIKTLNMLKNGNNINFWFLSKDSSYMLRSGDMNQKGNVIFL